MGVIKNRTDIQSLREAGRIAGLVLDTLVMQCQVGMSTLVLEDEANRILQQNRSSAPFKSFEGFGHATCISLNEEIVNGPPTRERILKDGDVVSIAIGTCIRGMHGKAATTCVVGAKASEDVYNLVWGTYQVIASLPEYAQQVVTLQSLMERVPQIAAEYQVTVLKNAGGAGIGKQLHEPPWIPNRPEEIEADIMLIPGLVLCIMPMMSLGSDQYTVHEDGWTQVTTDGSLAAHFAATFMMGDSGLENLTPFSPPTILRS